MYSLNSRAAAWKQTAPRNNDSDPKRRYRFVGKNSARREAIPFFIAWRQSRESCDSAFITTNSYGATLAWTQRMRPPVQFNSVYCLARPVLDRKVYGERN